MEVNRPFFITITDDETDTILFMGSIGNPQTKKLNIIETYTAMNTYIEVRRFLKGDWVDEQIFD